MSLKTRIEAIERYVATLKPAETVDAERQEEEDRLDAMLSLIHDDMIETVVAAMENDPEKYCEITKWLSYPFERWVTELPEDFRFPRALVEFILNPPRSYWMGHGCEECGLVVPIISTWDNDPDPPAKLRVFDDCPACGGMVSYAAGSQKGPKGRECFLP
ncbi:MAG: hypothetical protein U0798_07420 [Gemmataceae bacterium]